MEALLGSLSPSISTSSAHSRRNLSFSRPLSALCCSSSPTINKSATTVKIIVPNTWSSSAPCSRFQRVKVLKPISAAAPSQWFTGRAIRALVHSQKEAKTLGMQAVLNHHLLLGLTAVDVFFGSSITMEFARHTVCAIWNVSHPHLESLSSYVPFSSASKRVLHTAVELSRNMGHPFIAPEHIALALFIVDDSNAAHLIISSGTNINNLVAILVSRLPRMQPKYAPPNWIRQSSFSTCVKIREKSIIAQCCVDLTAQAREGLIDPVIGRQSEIKRIIQILCRRSKNNPILLGESGVGKTAIVEGLALSLALAEAPVCLLNKRIMSLDIGLLVAGTKERGELEARIITLLSDVKKSGNIILFIDEAHTLVGSAKVGQRPKGSGLDIADMLKSALGRGKLQCIASTTIEEYRMHFEKDKGLVRRFQPVLIKEPNQEDALQILLGLREKYETHHKCRFTLESIKAAVNLSTRYIPNRCLPDKAIDLIDEAGSRARIDAFKKQKRNRTAILLESPDTYWQEIRTVNDLHKLVLANMPYHKEHIYTLADNCNRKIDPLMPSTLCDDEPVVVEPDDIATIASLCSGIPLEQLTEGERNLLMGLDEKIKKQIVGQREAIGAVSRAVKRSRLGLKDPNKPMGTLLFCGPSGVGKTELAKVLAACYFGSEATMIRLDMSEYMERHAVSRLIGSPPGYVGYAEQGTLTEAIRKRPFTLVLLDEIEKAHPDVFSVLLQMLEDGHLADAQGKRVSFKDALVVMTSNVGSMTILKGGQRYDSFSIANESTSYAGMKASLLEELKACFCTEFLNRIDEIVVFHGLEKSQMVQVLNYIFEDVEERLASRGIGLAVTEAVKELICQQSYNESNGGWSLKKAVTSMVEDLLSEALLVGNYMPGDTAFIQLDTSGNLVVTKRSHPRI